MHDAGVCLMDENGIIAAIDEERISRKKRDGNFPILAFEAALSKGDLTAQEITDVAFVDRRTPWQTFQVWKYTIAAFFQARVRPWRYLWYWTRLMLQFKRVPPKDVKAKKIRFYEHHLCHAASAYYPGPFKDATIVTLDGMGDFSIGGMVAKGASGQLKVLRRSNGYFSPGHFYMILTEYLGFVPGKHEGKITGLAAYGDPKVAYHTMEKIIQYRKGKLDFIAPMVAKEFFSVIRSAPRTRTKQWYSQEQWEEVVCGNEIVPEEENTLIEFRKLWSNYSKEDIAAAGQARFEDVILAYIKDAVKLTGCSDLVVAGGCFANVKLNQKIRELPEISGLYVHPNMSDGGLATGAALLHLHDINKNKMYEHKPWNHVYLGPDFSEHTIEEELKASGLQYSKSNRIPQVAGDALSKGEVVAWFQGAMEYGPRALGHRSLLAAATDAHLPDRLNQKLGRTEFMPFAPIVLVEHARDWFEDWETDHVSSRYMTVTYDVVQDRREFIPAVVHVDGTARPQVLEKDINPLLHATLSHYYAITGIPLVVNTSFNMHEEPIVCSPYDAIQTFKNGAADMLIIGPFVARN
ncbi:MAG: carbamoyltransferase [Candidatus Poseidoniaceae archaeon]